MVVLHVLDPILFPCVPRKVAGPSSKERNNDLLLLGACTCNRPSRHSAFGDVDISMPFGCTETSQEGKDALMKVMRCVRDPDRSDEK